MVNHPNHSETDMKRRALIGPESTRLPALKEMAPEPPNADNYRYSIDRATVGKPQRIEIPWADLTPSQVRALAKDMLEAWSIVEALTHREDLTQKQMLMRCRSAVNDGAGRLPKRTGGRSQKNY